MELLDDEEKRKPSAFVEGVGWWPFEDDLDEYERELADSYARGEWQLVDNHEAELERYRELARIARATGNYGPVPDGVTCPSDWLEYVRKGALGVVAEARARKDNLLSYEDDIHETDADIVFKYSTQDAAEQMVRLINDSDMYIPPWIKPWKEGPDWGAQRSIRGRLYSGFNQLITTCYAYRHRYNDYRWLTIEEITKRGGSLKPGAEPVLVVGFFNVNSSQNYPNSDGDLRAKIFSVFNVEQTIGCITPMMPVTHEPVANPITLAEVIWKKYPPTRPGMRNNSNQAVYLPEFDFIEMPSPSSFEPTEEYYSTFFHEMIHSTGHVSRLDRWSKEMDSSESIIHLRYPREELVAELGANNLCAKAGITRTSVEVQHLAYIHSWWNAVQQDPMIIYIAAERAQTAVDFILGN